MGKHVRAATHGTNTLIHASEEPQGGKKVRPPSSKILKSDLMAASNVPGHTKTSSSGAQQKVVKEKIASSGKVFASGAVVKKPTTKIVNQIQHALA